MSTIICGDTTPTILVLCEGSRTTPVKNRCGCCLNVVRVKKDKTLIVHKRRTWAQK